MRKMRWLAYLWPGLPQLWQYGSWSGLLLSLGMAVALDLLLLASFGWSELIPGNYRSISWIVFAMCWSAVALVFPRIHGRKVLGSGQTGKDGFPEALEHYLRGDYYQAEQVLDGLLRQNMRDLDARLMLATLFRRAGRFEEATRQLDTLVRFEGAGKWELEIRGERRRLAGAKAHKATIVDETAAVAGKATAA